MHSKSSFNAVKAPLTRMNDYLRDTGAINVKSIYEAKKRSQIDNRTDKTSSQGEILPPTNRMRSSSDQ